MRIELGVEKNNDRSLCWTFTSFNPSRVLSARIEKILSNYGVSVRWKTPDVMTITDYINIDVINGVVKTWETSSINDSKRFIYDLNQD